MMADKIVTTGDENAADDKSGDKWFVPNRKMGEYEDEGGTEEAGGHDSMQSFDKWSGRPSEEDSDKWSRSPSEKDGNIDSNESEYAQSDEAVTDDDSDWEDIPDSFDSSEEDLNNLRNESEYEDEGGTEEASGQDSMQSFDKWSRSPGEEDGNLDSNESEYAQSDEEVADDDSDWEVILDSSDSSEEDLNNLRNESEYEDEGGTEEASGQDSMQSFDKWSRSPSEEDGNIDSNESEYAQSDEKVTYDDSDWEGIPDSSDSSEEDLNNLRNESEYAPSNEGRTDEDRGQDEKWSSPSVDYYANGSIQSGIKLKQFYQEYALQVAIVEKKFLKQKKRIRWISFVTAFLTSFTSLYTNRIDMDLIKREVLHYVKVFGLDQIDDERIEGLNNNFSHVSVEDFVLERLRGNDNILTQIYGIPCICIPIQAGCEARKFVDGFLSDVLSELKQDAIAVDIHLLKRGRR